MCDHFLIGCKGCGKHAEGGIDAHAHQKHQCTLYTHCLHSAQTLHPHGCTSKIPHILRNLQHTHILRNLQHTHLGSSWLALRLPLPVQHLRLRGPCAHCAGLCSGMPWEGSAESAISVTKYLSQNYGKETTGKHRPHQ